MSIEKRLIGHIGVDAGICWIGDPCYVFHREEGLPETLGVNWSDFCDKLGDEYPTTKSFGFKPGGSGLGICVSTGYGDGEYPVYAMIEDNRVKSITVKFF